MTNEKTKRKKMEDTAIAYQNKDIASKIFGENLKEKSFAAYGVKLPKVVDVLPTNLPIIEANELRIDNLFLLEDGSLALVDYESDYADENKIKYLNYVVRTLKRNMKINHLRKKIRMIVIYTADIEPEQTSSRLDVGCLQFQMEEAFLSEINASAIEAQISEKIQKKISLTSEEQMQLIILPLTHKTKEEKQESVKRNFELVKNIEDEKIRTFVLSGMLVFADKIVTREESKRIKDWIMMTKVGQLFEEEKQEAIKEAIKETTKQVTEQATKKAMIGAARKMLLKNMPVEVILDITESLTRKELEQLEKEISK